MRVCFKLRFETTNWYWSDKYQLLTRRPSVPPMHKIIALLWGRPGTVLALEDFFLWATERIRAIWTALRRFKTLKKIDFFCDLVMQNFKVVSYTEVSLFLVHYVHHRKNNRNRRDRRCRNKIKKEMLVGFFYPPPWKGRRPRKVWSA